MSDKKRRKLVTAPKAVNLADQLMEKGSSEAAAAVGTAYGDGGAELIGGDVMLQDMPEENNDALAK